MKIIWGNDNLHPNFFFKIAPYREFYRKCDRTKTSPFYMLDADLYITIMGKMIAFWTNLITFSKKLFTEKSSKISTILHLRLSCHRLPNKNVRWTKISPVERTIQGHCWWVSLYLNLWKICNRALKIYLFLIKQGILKCLNWRNYLKVKINIAWRSYQFSVNVL